MKAIKKPIPIEVALFLADAHARVPIAEGVIIHTSDEGRHTVWNALHKSWIGVRDGDYLNITKVDDIYPIDKATFEATYDIIGKEE
jgi:hypothetical protein